MKYYKKQQMGLSFTHIVKQLLKVAFIIVS